MKGPVGRRGKRYTIDGISIQPRKFVGRVMTKWTNFIIKWAVMDDREALRLAQKVLVERYLECGIAFGRAPLDFAFLPRGGFWDEPHLYRRVVSLTEWPEEGFKLSELEKKVIRKQAQLGIKHGFYFDRPILFTIGAYRPDMGDPRRSQKEVHTWNGHYLSKVGRYLRELEEELGYVPFLHDISPGYNSISPSLSTQQIENMCQRWHVRGAPGPVGITQSGSGPYKPVLDKGGWSPDDIRVAPAAEGEWWKIGRKLEGEFGERKLPLHLMSPVVLVAGKTPRSNLDLYAGMLREAWNYGQYVCINDAENDDGDPHGGGQSAGWVPGFDDKPGRVDEFIKDVMGLTQPPPPPDPVEDPWWLKLLKWLLGLGKG